MNRRILLVTALLGAVFASSAFGAGVQVIVHKGTSLSNISGNDLESIFLGKMTLWDGGGKITPVLVREESAAGRHFIESILNKRIDQYRNYWKRRLFSGGGTVPRTFSSSNEVLEYVAKTEGAIGIVEAGAADERVRLVSLAK